MDNMCKCGGVHFFMETKGNQTGLYCSDCGKWQKWLTKDEIRLMKHQQQNHNREYSKHDMKLVERLKARISESAIKVSTVKAPHTYMKAVGTKELERIIEEEFNEK